MRVNVEWSFYIFGYILKTKYKNMAIVSSFFFPPLVIKIFKSYLHFWNFKFQENCRQIKNEFAFKVCTRSEYLSRYPGSVTKYAFNNIFMWNNQTPANFSAICTMKCILLSVSTDDASHAQHMELTYHLCTAHRPRKSALVTFILVRNDKLSHGLLTRCTYCVLNLTIHMLCSYFKDMLSFHGEFFFDLINLSST